MHFYISETKSLFLPVPETVSVCHVYFSSTHCDYNLRKKNIQCEYYISIFIVKLEIIKRLIKTKIFWMCTLYYNVDFKLSHFLYSSVQAIYNVLWRVEDTFYEKSALTENTEVCTKYINNNIKY